MAAYLACIPNGQSSWTQRTALDGVDFILTFDWCQRFGHWRLDIADAQGVAIKTGVALTADVMPLLGLVDPRRPKGELMVVDRTGATDADPGFADLGGRFLLAYFSAADLAG